MCKSVKQKYSGLHLSWTRASFPLAVCTHICQSTGNWSQVWTQRETVYMPCWIQQVTNLQKLFPGNDIKHTKFFLESCFNLPWHKALKLSKEAAHQIFKWQEQQKSSAIVSWVAAKLASKLKRRLLEIEHSGVSERGWGDLQNSLETRI